ncbi:AAA family ATPase [Mycolicibacterium hodleri]|uniref:AAA family ATPase n=1 Tax=Mycolicibacterium hodleri TaxID=49897 RepID=UPI0021F2EF9A|nr:AAA family ATPase [Mycolicibacterium hodleri]
MEQPAGGALLVVSGLPGVGKTAVATEIARRLGAVHLSVDPVEEALLACGLPPGWNLGVAAYEAVASMAAANVALGRTVVVDAVNDSHAARDTWRRVTASVTFVVLACSDPDEHRRRLERRHRGFTRVAEPSWSKVCDRARDYAPWRGEFREVDTTGLSVAEVCDRLGVK